MKFEKEYKLKDKTIKIELKCATMTSDEHVSWVLNIYEKLPRTRKWIPVDGKVCDRFGQYHDKDTYDQKLPDNWREMVFDTQAEMFKAIAEDNRHVNCLYNQMY